MSTLVGMPELPTLFTRSPWCCSTPFAFLVQSIWCDGSALALRNVQIILLKFLAFRCEPSALNPFGLVSLCKSCRNPPCKQKDADPLEVAALSNHAEILLANRKTCTRWRLQHTASTREAARSSSPPYSRDSHGAPPKLPPYKFEGEEEEKEGQEEEEFEAAPPTGHSFIRHWSQTNHT